MAQKWKKVLSCLVGGMLLTVLLVAANVYSQNRKMTVSTNFIMDTVVEQKLYGRHSKEAAAEIEKRLKEYEQSCSMYLSESEISLLNQNAGKQYTTLSPQCLRMIERAKQIAESSNGLLDITIAPLTSLWGITEENPKVPPQEEIEAARKLVDYHDILIDGDRVMLKREGQSIDLGAVAKGAACDIVKQVAKKYDIKSGYVSIGGNLVVLGDDPDGKEWFFAVRDPQGNASEYIGTLSLTGKTMATTGTYERWFEQDGKRYHHILDPRTGYPAESDLLSVSVISEDGLLADCLSTALFMEGKDAALVQMQETEYQLILVDTEGTVYYSPSLEGNFEPNPDKTATYRFESRGDRDEKDS